MDDDLAETKACCIQCEQTEEGTENEEENTFLSSSYKQSEQTHGKKDHWRFSCVDAWVR